MEGATNKDVLPSSSRSSSAASVESPNHKRNTVSPSLDSKRSKVEQRNRKTGEEDDIDNNGEDDRKLPAKRTTEEANKRTSHYQQLLHQQTPTAVNDHDRLITAETATTKPVAGTRRVTANLNVVMDHPESHKTDDRRSSGMVLDDQDRTKAKQEPNIPFPTTTIQPKVKGLLARTCSNTPSPVSVSVTIEPTFCDVLLGPQHGSQYHMHAGNRRLMTLLHSHYQWYHQSNFKDKATVIRNLVRHIKSNDGRFLKVKTNLNSSSNTNSMEPVEWVEVPDDYACMQILHLLLHHSKRRSVVTTPPKNGNSRAGLKKPPPVAMEEEDSKPAAVALQKNEIETDSEHEDDDDNMNCAVLNPPMYRGGMNLLERDGVLPAPTSSSTDNDENEDDIGETECTTRSDPERNLGKEEPPREFRVQANDVVFSPKGGIYDSFMGNFVFQKMVERSAASFLEAESDAAKASLVDDLIRSVETMKPAGRFWVEVPGSLSGKLEHASRSEINTSVLLHLEKAAKVLQEREAGVFQERSKGGTTSSSSTSKEPGVNDVVFQHNGMDQSTLGNTFFLLKVRELAPAFLATPLQVVKTQLVDNLIRFIRTLDPPGSFWIGVPGVEQLAVEAESTSVIKTWVSLYLEKAAEELNENHVAAGDNSTLKNDPLNVTRTRTCDDSFEPVVVDSLSRSVLSQQQQEDASALVISPDCNDIILPLNLFQDAGNAQFREMVDVCLQCSYETPAVERLQHMALVQGLIDAVHGMDPPGRFLVPVLDDLCEGIWRLAEEEVVRQKVSDFVELRSSQLPSETTASYTGGSRSERDNSSFECATKKLDDVDSVILDGVDVPENEVTGKPRIDLDRNDVLIDGSRDLQTKGYQKLLFLALKMSKRFRSAKIKEKTEMCQSLVEAIQNMDPPGRFLVRRKRKPFGSSSHVFYSDKEEWQQANPVQARNKALQCLRRISFDQARTERISRMEALGSTDWGRPFEARRLLALSTQSGRDSPQAEFGQRRIFSVDGRNPLKGSFGPDAPFSYPEVDEFGCVKEDAGQALDQRIAAMEASVASAPNNRSGQWNAVLKAKERQYDDAVIQVALYNYECYYGLERGTASFEVLLGTSAGVEGWASAVVPEKGETIPSAAGNAGGCPDYDLEKKFAPRGDAEENRMLQQALLESIGVCPQIPPSDDDLGEAGSAASFGQYTSGEDYYCYESSEGEWSEDESEAEEDEASEVADEKLENPESSDDEGVNASDSKKQENDSESQDVERQRELQEDKNKVSERRAFVDRSSWQFQQVVNQVELSQGKIMERDTMPTTEGAASDDLPVGNFSGLRESSHDQDEASKDKKDVSSQNEDSWSEVSSPSSSSQGSSNSSNTPESGVIVEKSQRFDKVDASSNDEWEDVATAETGPGMETIATSAYDVTGAKDDDWSDVSA